MTKPWMDEKWFQQNIKRLHEILNGSPWEVRTRLAVYLEKLEGATTDDTQTPTPPKEI